MYFIVNNENMMNRRIRGVALNKLLVFLVWVSKVKSLCNVCVPLYILCFY
jgi:hypothetical protein